MLAEKACFRVISSRKRISTSLKTHILVDGHYCMSCGSDKSLKLWNPYKAILLKTYMGVGSEILDAAGSSDNSMILCGGVDKQPTIFDVESGKMIKRWKGKI